MTFTLDSGMPMMAAVEARMAKAPWVHVQMVIRSLGAHIAVDAWGSM